MRTKNAVSKSYLSDSETVKVLEKYRDILRMYEDKFLLLVIGVENQSDTNYCMPLRHMMYDVMKYEHQRVIG